MLPLPQFDHSSDEPIYRQLRAFVRDAILSGRLALGERIPPTRELAGLLGLNRTTVASAYELLETEGLIRGHVGRGSFVAGPAPVDGAITWDERFKLDVWYVDNWSLGLDLRILLRTFVKVILREGISAEGQATMSRFTGNAK